MSNIKEGGKKGMGDITSALKKFFSNYAKFDGRTSRKDYWLTFLGIYVATFAVYMIGWLLAEVTISISSLISGELSEVVLIIVGILVALVIILAELVIIIPWISMTVRRFHDIGKPGIWVLFCYLGSCCCGIGSIVQIVLCCMPGNIGPNAYGPDPNNDYKDNI